MSRYQLFFQNKFLSNTKLMEAVGSRDCNPMDIRKLLNENPEMLNQCNIAGETPLHFAINHGQSLENVVELLKQGAHVNNVHFNTSPLHAAAGKCCKEQYGMLKVLLGYGADINKRDFNDHTPLRILLKTMKEKYQERSLYLLLSNNADVNTFESENVSILKVALMNPFISINAIKMLLEFGANANDCIGYSVTDLPVAKVLLQYILIKRMANTGTSVLSKQILDLKFFEYLRYYQELVEYRDSCIMELTSMKLVKINDDCSLFSYVNDRCSTPKVNKNDLKTSITSTVLAHHNKYYYCKDLIIASLKEKCIVNELRNADIYVWKNDAKLDAYGENYKVSLNGDAIHALATYLSKSDLINLTLAYMSYPKLSLSKRNSNFIKRNYCGSNHYDQSAKYPKFHI